MLFPAPVWLVVGATLVVFLGVGYKLYLHPSWRKERRVLQACNKAFEKGDYRLMRLHTTPEQPSISDIIPRPLGFPDVPHYFTYSIETREDVEPDFSGLHRREIVLVRRYLHRSTSQLVHNGKELLRPEGEPMYSSRERSAAGSEIEE